MERDQLTFAAERCGDHLGILCRGVDSHGSRFEFELVPSTLRGNLERQARWAVRVEMVGELLDALLAEGVDVNAAWSLIGPMLPMAHSASASGRSAEAPTQISDKPFEDGDQHLGQPSDGDGRVGRRTLRE